MAVLPPNQRPKVLRWFSPCSTTIIITTTITATTAAVSIGTITIITITIGDGRLARLHADALAAYPFRSARAAPCRRR